MFSMARYFYTYHHDTSENEKYYIKSNLFNKQDNHKKIKFNIKYIWNKQTQKKLQNFFLIRKIKKNLITILITLDLIFLTYFVY